MREGTFLLKAGVQLVCVEGCSFHDGYFGGQNYMNLQNNVVPWSPYERTI